LALVSELTWFSASRLALADDPDDVRANWPLALRR
jgi:hypothetical protein